MAGKWSFSTPQQHPQQKRKRSLLPRAERQSLRVIVAMALTLMLCSSTAAFVPQGKNHKSFCGSRKAGLPLFRPPLSISATSDTADNTADEGDSLMEELEQKLVYIQALEERNKAQIDSFVDEEDQWESMEEFERELLSSKEDIEKQLNDLLSKEK